MCWECWKRFPHHRKPLVSDPGMHHGMCVTHVLWCMLGSLTRGGGENVPGIPGACTTRNVTYLVKSPLMTDPCFEFCRCGKMNSWRGTKKSRAWETCVLNLVTSGPRISGVTRGKSTQWSHYRPFVRGIRRWLRPQPWMRHSMETPSALLAFCEGNLPINGGLSLQRASDSYWWSPLALEMAWHRYEYMLIKFHGVNYLDYKKKKNVGTLSAILDDIGTNATVGYR